MVAKNKTQETKRRKIDPLCPILSDSSDDETPFEGNQEKEETTDVASGKVPKSQKIEAGFEDFSFDFKEDIDDDAIGKKKKGLWGISSKVMDMHKKENGLTTSLMEKIQERIESKKEKAALEAQKKAKNAEKEKKNASKKKEVDKDYGFEGDADDYVPDSDEEEDDDDLDMEEEDDFDLEEEDEDSDVVSVHEEDELEGDEDEEDSQQDTKAAEAERKEAEKKEAERKEAEKKAADEKKVAAKKEEAKSSSALPKREFADLGLSRPFLKALQEMGYTEPTDVQQQSIPHVLKGTDILATAETGSGKTAAFLLPIVERISACPHVRARKSVFDKKTKTYKITGGQIATKALILIPTRELATQCYSMLQEIGKYSRVTSSLIAGGFSQQEQVAALRAQPDILICTPGRILDHLLNTQSVHLEMLEIVVFDEADRLLELGFRDECKEVLKRANSRNRQTILFSATFSTDVRDLAAIALNAKNMKRVEVNKVNKVTNKKLVQEFVSIPDKQLRESTLVALCRNTYKSRAIIFFGTKKHCHRMAIVFGLMGLKFAELHGNLSQKERSENVDNFQRGKVDFLLATDLAGRGLDLPNVEVVINFEVPDDDAKYIHRVGRTARMGNDGTAVTLHCGPEEYRRVKKLANLCVKERKKVNSDAGDGASSVMMKRQVAQDQVESILDEIKGLQADIDAINMEEQEEKEMRMAEQGLEKATNLEKHKSTISARPEREWVCSNSSKKKRIAEMQHQAMEKRSAAFRKDRPEGSKESKRMKAQRMAKESLKKQSLHSCKKAKSNVRKNEAKNGGSKGQAKGQAKKKLRK